VPEDQTALDRRTAAHQYVNRAHDLGLKVDVDNVAPALETLDEADEPQPLS
jgi:hypothetical protein